MMRKNASRMRVVSVYDLSASESIRALRHLRRLNLLGHSKGAEVEVESDEILSQVYERVGGRTSYLAKVSRADDMLGQYPGVAGVVESNADNVEEAENMIEMEKGWLLSKLVQLGQLRDAVQADWVGSV